MVEECYIGKNKDKNTLITESKWTHYQDSLSFLKTSMNFLSHGRHIL